MIVKTLDFDQTGAFSSLFLEYVQQSEALKPFFSLPPRPESFPQAIQEKATSFNAIPQGREVLAQALKQQYQSISNPPTAQIDTLLQENTFTVTTGHQLNIFTGPLYFIYKIVTTINLAATLKNNHPEYHFVPVYWMATEDHDFAEINHFHLFNKKYSWETDQKGAVGHFHTKDMAPIFEEIAEALPLFQQSYMESDNLCEATRKIVHELFGDQGLIIIDGDDAALKKQFAPVIQSDLFAHSAHPLVTQKSAALEALGHKAQVFPREINFFYLDHQLRERIIKTETGFEVNNTSLTFSEEQMNALIQQSPEKFSPNVVLRPLYQEMILPNLAYVGGPGELAYWLQLKDVFAHYQTPYPILMPRNFALLLNKTSSKRVDKLGVSLEDLFLDEHPLKTKYLTEHAENEIFIEEEKANLTTLFEALVSKASAIDKSLEGFIGAEKNKALKSLDNIEKRLKKAEENKQKTAINQLISLKEKLFPNGKLQERHDNMLNFYLNQPEILEIFLNHFHPFEFKMQILVDI